MPIYEYLCQACEQVSDALQKISDDPLVTCPECHEDALKKLISAPRFRLAGSGWYETDFKKDNQRNLAKSENDPNSSDAEKKAKKADKSTADTKKEMQGENKTVDAKVEKKSENKVEAKA